MQVHDLGLIEYSKSLKVQDDAVLRVLEHGSKDEVILVCEHPAVITVGRAIDSEKEVFDHQLPIFEVPRGGRATLHLPGQIVVYPVLNLEERGKDLHSYMRLLEASVVDTLADFRIEARGVEGKTGVWVSQSRRGSIPSMAVERKIASIGIAVKKWISYHGLAVNVTCDLDLFKGLSPCGFSGDVMTSVFDELADSYKATWAVEKDVLLKNIKIRLIENLLSLLERVPS